MAKAVLVLNAPIDAESVSMQVVAQQKSRVHARLFNYRRQVMQHYLHIGGDKDSLSFPAPDDTESLQWQFGLTDKETYNRSTLTLGDVSVVVYVHESLTPKQALSLLVDYYKAWCVNRPGGRH